MIKQFWTLGILIAGSVMDIRKKSVPAAYLLVAAAGSLLFLVADPADMQALVLGLIPGLVLLVLGKRSGSVGTADALLFLILGALYGIYESGEFFMYALIVAALYSMVLIVSRRADRKSSMPFIPFLAAGFLLYWMRSLNGGG